MFGRIELRIKVILTTRIIEQIKEHDSYKVMVKLLTIKIVITIKMEFYTLFFN